ncbi:MAG: helix-turn-helix domain-containing protein [Christensenellales bacterium]
MIIYNLRNSRENMDLKQKDIAEMFGVHFATVSGWETGKDTIPLERLIEYANRFNFSLDYLFGITKQNDTSYLPLEIDLNVIAQNLRKIRKSHNLTQADVAKRINTSQASYAHYENSVNLIPTTFLYNLTDIYKPFSIDKLLGRKKQ